MIILEIIGITILGITGSILAKIFFFTTVRIEFIFKRMALRNEFLVFLIPFSSIYKTKKFPQKEKSIFKVVEALGWISFIIFGISIFNVYQDINLVSALLHFVYYIIILIGILYLAVYDTVNFSIPIPIIKKLLFFALLANIIVGVVKVLYYRIYGDHVLQAITLGQFENLVGALFLVLLTWIVVKTTKEEGLGDGDIDVHAIVGLSLGWPIVVPYILLTLILGSILSVGYASYVKKFKHVLIPFVPFILIGYVIAIGFGNKIFDVLFINI